MAKIPLTLENLDGVVGGAYVSGGAGNDDLEGGLSFDLIRAGDGNDAVDGGWSSDVLMGGDGNDTINGGTLDRASDVALGGDGNDTFVWSPGSGSDVFDGGSGQDTLRLPTMSLDGLKAGLQLDDGLNVTMQTNAAGQVSFVDAAGQPQSVSGTITVGGETLRFSSLEAIELPKVEAQKAVTGTISNLLDKLPFKF